MIEQLKVTAVRIDIDSILFISEKTKTALAYNSLECYNKIAIKKNLYFLPKNKTIHFKDNNMDETDVLRLGMAVRQLSFCISILAADTCPA